MINEFEVFITPYCYQLHFFEEWVPTEIMIKYTESIVNLWIKREIDGYLFKHLFSCDIHDEIDRIIFRMKDILINERPEDKTTNTQISGASMSMPNYPQKKTFSIT
ncbi:hypothetical protein ACCI51_01695 [Microbulbifer echini]|uniref:Uncharacterized protein n=1 Tax=Microbulbifer echini TaxID=1529067 RepID=A0ABV4NJ39_9GAMM